MARPPITPYRRDQIAAQIEVIAQRREKLRQRIGELIEDAVKLELEDRLREKR